MPTGGKKTTGTAKGPTGAKLKQPATSKPTKTDNTTQNNTSVGSDEEFLFTGSSPKEKEVKWLKKLHILIEKKEKVDESNKFSQNLERLYDALLKELSTRCGVKYESVFNTVDNDQSETEMMMNVTPRVNTEEKDLLDKLAKSAAKQQELNEGNNKLKDQLTSYQDKSKKFEKEAVDYKREVDAKTAENDQLKQNISEMKKRISEIKNQQKMTKPPEKSDDTLNMLKDDTLNLQKKKFEKQADDYKKEVDAKTAENNQLKQNISEMKKRISEIENQQKMTKPPEKSDDTLNMLKDDMLNLQKKNEIQEKTDSSNKELIERLTTENKKLSSQTQQMQQKIDALTKEQADVLKQKENLEKGLKDANNNITTLNKDNEKNKIKLEEGDSKRTALQNENSDLKKQLQNLHDQLKGAKSENVTQGKTDSSNKEQITSLTDENKKIKLKHKELEQQQIKLQQQQREESQRSEEKINILTAEKESLETVVSQIKKQVGQEVDHHNRKSENLSKNLMSKEHDIMDIKRTKIEIERRYSSLQKQIDEQTSTIKRLEEEKRKINKEKKFAALDPDQKLKEVQEENEKLRDRLSKVAGMKLTEGNPAIADLGDPNRPTQLGEKFAEMYDNEWTDAMEELTNAGDEKSSINTLKTIVEKSYEFGKTRAASYVKGLEKAFLDLSNGIEVTDIISKYIKDHRKNTALLVLDGLYKSFVRDHKEYNVGGDGVKNFIKKAVSLCWLMAIQDPPVVLTTKLTGKFDTDRFRHYTKSGSTVDYVVWPVLFLHEGGPIICKGVAQGK